MRRHSDATTCFPSNAPKYLHALSDVRLAQNSQVNAIFGSGGTQLYQHGAAGNQRSKTSYPPFCFYYLLS